MLGPPAEINRRSYLLRARAVTLFYRERLDRVLVAFNRFSLFGDVGFAVAVDRADVARDGDSYDIVVGPKDNNLMGTPLRAIWHGWRHFRSRTAELTLIRMLRGFEFYVSVSGVRGLTSRIVLTGYTLDIDGVSRTATRSRAAVPVASPMPTDTALEAETIEAFFDGLRVKVRSDLKDTYLTFLPGRSRPCRGGAGPLRRPTGERSKPTLPPDGRSSGSPESAR